MSLYVQYGCGLCAPDGWVNFDASPTLRLQKIPVLGRFSKVRFPASARFGDIRLGLPIAPASADAVYCSHVLEHLALDDLRLALKNTAAILRPGGVFRLVLPNLKISAQEYIQSTQPDAAIRFMEATLLGRKTRPRGLSGLLRSWLGNSEHLWMWDFDSLSMELTKAGFGSIRPAVAGDSGDAMFDKVEDAGRWNGALGIQCLRPLSP